VSDDELELSQIKKSLLEIVRVDVRGSLPLALRQLMHAATVAALMQQIGHGVDEVKAKTLDFMQHQVAPILPELVKNKAELAISVGEAIETVCLCVECKA
jgi:hypothetical protein